MGCGIDSRNRLVAEAELALAPAKAAHRFSSGERTGAPPGAKARSRPNGAYRNLRGPSAATGWSPVGTANEGQPQVAAPRMGVRPLHSIGEVAEGNEAMERRERQEGITMEQAKGRTQRWQPLLPNLLRVNEAAIAPPPVLPEEPAAVTPHGGICGGKSWQWLRYLSNLHAGFCLGDEYKRPCRLGEDT